MTMRIPLTLLLLLLAAGLGCRPETHERYLGERPDVLLVVIDALRRDAVGVYGSGRPTTPFLDRLAGVGVAFENAYSQSPHTFQSTATLMTSRYFPLVGASPGFEPIPGLPEDLQRRHAEVPYLAEENLTLAEALQGADYQTVGFFTNPHHHATSGFWQGFDEPRFLPRHSARKPYARAPRVVRSFLAWLDGRQDSGPYFAYLHVMDVHAPYNPPRELRREFVKVAGKDRYMTGKPAGEERPSAADLAYMRGLYDGEVRLVDDSIRFLVAAIEERGRWGDTLLVVTSDHGDEFMDHGGLGHGTTLEKELIHIPLLLGGAGLGSLPGERRRPQPIVRNLDLMPTILEIAGVENLAEMDGESLLPTFMGGEGRPRSRTSFASIRSLRSLTDGKWHFIQDLESGATTLYDNELDPRGEDDVAAAHPAIVERFQQGIAAFEDWRRQTAEAARSSGDRPPPPVDPAILEQLRALGYL